MLAVLSPEPSCELEELELAEALDRLLNWESDCLAQYLDGQLSHVNEVITQYSPDAQTGHDTTESQITHPSLPLAAEVEAVAVLDKVVLVVTLEELVIFCDSYEQI